MRAMEKMRGLWRDQQGLSTVEYVVLLVLIVGLSVGVWNEFGGAVKDRLGAANSAYQKKVPAKL